MIEFVKQEKRKYQFTLERSILFCLLSFFTFIHYKLNAQQKDTLQVIHNQKGIFSTVFHSIHLRNGKLYNKDEILKNIKSTLKPLDIILEKSPFQITDKFIPGHFGHVAIWLGYKSDLIQLGVWNDPKLLPYQKYLEADTNGISFNIVEALPSGVQMNSINEFLNVDDLAIVRIDSNLIPNKKESILLAIEQLGKEYDFRFDIETKDKIVCSELIYHCFPIIAWEIEKLIGRYTISPDNILHTCLENCDLEVISFYHKGKEISDEDKIELLYKLTRPRKLWIKNK